MKIPQSTFLGTIKTKLVLPTALAAASVLPQGCTSVQPSATNDSSWAAVAHSAPAVTASATKPQDPSIVKFEIPIPGLENYKTENREFKLMLESTVADAAEVIAQKKQYADVKPSPKIQEEIALKFLKVAESLTAVSLVAETAEEYKALQKVASLIKLRMSTGTNPGLNFRFQPNEHGRSVHLRLVDENKYFPHGIYGYQSPFHSKFEEILNGTAFQEAGPKPSKYSQSTSVEFVKEYNGLVDSLDKLDKMQAKFSQLKRGSQEFQKHVDSFKTEAEKISLGIGYLVHNAVYSPDVTHLGVLNGQEGKEIVRLVLSLQGGAGTRSVFWDKEAGASSLVLKTDDGEITIPELPNYGSVMLVVETWNDLMDKYSALVDTTYKN